MGQELVEEFVESDTIHLIGTCRDWVIYPLFVVFFTNPRSFVFLFSREFALLCISAESAEWLLI